MSFPPLLAQTKKINRFPPVQMTPWAASWELQHMRTALKGSHFPSLARQCLQWHKSFTNCDQVWALVVVVWAELLLEETPVTGSDPSAEQMLCPTQLWIKLNQQLSWSYLEWCWALGHREGPPAGHGWSLMALQFRGKTESLQIKNYLCWKLPPKAAESSPSKLWIN